jgi:integrase
MSDWIHRWDDELRPTKVDGVWKRRRGGYRVRLRGTDKRTGKRTEINRVITEARSAKQALEAGRALLAERLAAGDRQAVPRFCDFAAELFERKVATGEIKSAAGRVKYASVLTNHLIPRFGDLFLDQLRRSDVEAWRTEMGKAIEADKLRPGTANSRLAALFAIVRAAIAELELERDPVRGVRKFDTSTHPTYTEEQPNSLAPSQVPAFLAKMRELWPRHYAMTALGFATGLRPSSLRPLRRAGDEADVLWETGELLVRRSHSDGSEIMETTKTGRRQRLALPDELVDILRWHVATQIKPGVAERTELLFPTRAGGLRKRGGLRKPFRSVCKAVKLPFMLTPRGMRRTFQDLARAANVRDVVTRSISGHATDAMQRHYSTVAADEQRAALGRVIELFPRVGDVRGDVEPESKIAQRES